jgi:hypothetical protein
MAASTAIQHVQTQVAPPLRALVAANEALSMKLTVGHHSNGPELVVVLPGHVVCGVLFASVH